MKGRDHDSLVVRGMDVGPLFPLSSPINLNPTKVAKNERLTVYFIESFRELMVGIPIIGRLYIILSFESIPKFWYDIHFFMTYGKI